MNKPNVIFYLEDNPGRVAADSRHETARRLRAYRARPLDYVVRIIRPGEYRVSMPFNSIPAAIIKTRQ